MTQDYLRYRQPIVREDERPHPQASVTGAYQWRDTNAGPQKFTVKAYDVDGCPECVCGHGPISHRVAWVNPGKAQGPRMAYLGLCVCRYEDCGCLLFSPKEAP